MPIFLRALFTLCMGWSLLAAGGVQAGTDIAPGMRFVSVAFHDVVDEPAQLEGDAVTTDRLVAFFDHLRGAGWVAVSLDDVDAARRGLRALPPKAVLITFDDGYRSLYTRVFPLLLAYRMPIVAALQGAWVAAPAGSSVRYGEQTVPREKFLSWEQAREMARSGLVEFASHSDEMHVGVPANPQGNLLPAAVTRRYADGRYEDAAAYRLRLLSDLQRSRDLLRRELGQAPRTLVWPFGRYSAEAVEVAAQAGFSFALTLDPEPADATTPMALARYLPTYDPTLAEIDSNLRFAPRLPAAQRLVCVDPAQVWAGDAAATDLRLGQLIERLRSLGSTAVVIDALAPGRAGEPAAAWFPNAELPLRADLLSRLVWQLQSRAGVEAYVRLPLAQAQAALGSEQRVLALFRDLGVQVAASGLFVEAAPGLAALRASEVPPGEPAAMPWQVRRLRHALDPAGLPASEALALRAFGEVERARPGLKLVLLAPASAPMQASAVADLTLFPAAAGAGLPARLAAERGPGVNAARRTGLWLASTAPPSATSLSQTLRTVQQAGGTVFGWCPDDTMADLPAAAQVAPAVSAATYPVKF